MARIEAKDVFTRWQDCLDALRSDIFSLADQLDWVAKLKLMESYRATGRTGWGAPKLALIDLQYSDVTPDAASTRRAEQGPDAPTGHRRRDRAGADLTAGGHPGVLRWSE